MPRIPKLYLDCIVYLYPNRADAEAGRPTGGSGFLLGVLGEKKEDLKLYIVTNAHVASGCTFVRLHNNGQVMFVEIAARKWQRHRHGDDVAMVRFEDHDVQVFPYINSDAFVTREMIIEYGISPGMDAFMMGRLTGRDGLQQTNPSVRFGHLSMMAEPILCDTGLRQESFLVDLSSLAGHSGSPVFVFESQQSFRGDASFRLQDVKLLGINWGFYRRKEKILAGSEAEPKDTDFWLDGNTGFACVVPSWKIRELLDDFDESAGTTTCSV